MTTQLGELGLQKVTEFKQQPVLRDSSRSSNNWVIIKDQYHGTPTKEVLGNDSKNAHVHMHTRENNDKKTFHGGHINYATSAPKFISQAVKERNSTFLFFFKLWFW